MHELLGSQIVLNGRVALHQASVTYDALEV